MEFYHYFPSLTFVVVTADQFVGRDDGSLEQQKQDRKIRVLATKTMRTKKLRIRNEILDI